MKPTTDTNTDRCPHCGALLCYVQMGGRVRLACVRGDTDACGRYVEPVQERKCVVK